MGTNLEHTESCDSVPARSEFDTSCPRCKSINTVIHLRRKTVQFGCSQQEMDSAISLADALIAKYELAPVECVDRLFIRAQQIETGEIARPKRRTKINKSQFDKLMRDGYILVEEPTELPEQSL